MDLIAVPGINEAKAKLVIAAAQDLLNQTLNQAPSSNSETSSVDVEPETEEGEEAGGIWEKEQKEEEQKEKIKEK